MPLTVNAMPCNANKKMELVTYHYLRSSLIYKVPWVEFLIERPCALTLFNVRCTCFDRGNFLSIFFRVLIKIIAAYVQPWTVSKFTCPAVGFFRKDNTKSTFLNSFELFRQIGRKRMLPNYAAIFQNRAYQRHACEFRLGQLMGPR